MPVLTVERPLREKLGDDAIDALINLINKSLGEQKNDVLKFVEEKFERRLSEEIGHVKVEIGSVRNEIYSAKSELIKWMFIFWVGQVGVILGILFAFFK